MVATKPRPIEHYIEKMKTKLLKKYPEMTFDVLKESEEAAVLVYSPDIKDESYAIIKQIGGIGIDALVDAGYRIHIQPSA